MIDAMRAGAERRASLLQGFRDTPPDTYIPRRGFLSGFRRAIFSVRYADDLNPMRTTIINALEDAVSIASAGIPLGSGLPPKKLQTLCDTLVEWRDTASSQPVERQRALAQVCDLLEESLRIAKEPTP